MSSLRLCSTSCRAETARRACRFGLTFSWWGELFRRSSQNRSRHSARFPYLLELFKRSLICDPTIQQTMKQKLLHYGLSLLTVTALISLVGQSTVLGAANPASIDRTVLPIKEPTYPESTVLDARDAKAPPRFEVKAPPKAPNVVIVLLDDVGFAASSAFGGPINMPTLDKLAANGLRYNRFHTTALCSPTRTALLTGRNHHVNNAGDRK